MFLSLNSDPVFSGIGEMFSDMLFTLPDMAIYTAGYGFLHCADNMHAEQSNH